MMLRIHLRRPKPHKRPGAVAKRERQANALTRLLARPHPRYTPNPKQQERVASEIQTLRRKLNVVEVG